MPGSYQLQIDILTPASLSLLFINSAKFLGELVEKVGEKNLHYRRNTLSVGKNCMKPSFMLLIKLSATGQQGVAVSILYSTKMKETVKLILNYTKEGESRNRKYYITE